MKRYPEHPAAKQLPKELLDLQQQLADLPKTNRPLNAPKRQAEAAASAIVDGLMAAYYQQQRNGALVPTLKFYNTEGAHTWSSTKSRARGRRYSYWPAGKERLAELNQQPNLPVPVLGLNTLEGASNRQLFQIGLSVEDEAKQIAAQALREGLRKGVGVATRQCPRRSQSGHLRQHLPPTGRHGL